MWGKIKNPISLVIPVVGLIGGNELLVSGCAINATQNLEQNHLKIYLG